MIELAKNCKEPSRFMPDMFWLKSILVLVRSDEHNMAYFKVECQKFSQIGSQMSEIMCGSNSIWKKIWKERNDLEKWLEQDYNLWESFLYS